MSLPQWQCAFCTQKPLVRLPLLQQLCTLTNAIYPPRQCSPPALLQGSGARIQQDFGLPNLIQFPIVEALSIAGDTGRPLVVDDPTSDVARCFSDLGVAVVREVEKAKRLRKNTVRYDPELQALVVQLPDEKEAFLLDPPLVRRNDTSARSVNEWTGERLLQDSDIPDTIRPTDIKPLGNYAVQVWELPCCAFASYN